jgi:import inner membrane translocase subunit TIM44
MAARGTSGRPCTGTHRSPAAQVGHVPILAKLMGFKVQDTSAYKKGEEFVADLKEKYETSDHPMVHKVRVCV